MSRGAPVAGYDRFEDRMKDEDNTTSPAEVVEAALRALDAGDVAVWDWNVTTGVFNSRGPWKRLLGSLPEKSGDRFGWFLELVHPEDRDRLARIAAEGRKDRKLDLTFRIVDPDGAVRWLAARGSIAHPENGSDIHLSGVMHDATEHVSELTTVNEALSRSEQLLRSVVENAPATIQTVDRQGTILTSNEPLAGKSLFQFVADHQRLHLHDVLRRVFDERETCYFEGESPGRGWFGARYAPIVEHDEVAAAVVVVFNITEQHKERAAVRDSEARFRAMAEASPVAIWRAGTDMGCQYVNGEFLRFAGRPIEGMLGTRWTDLVHPDERDHLLDEWLDAFEKRSNLSVEAQFRRVDGEYRLILAGGRPIHASDGTFEGYAGTCVDLTDIRRTEETMEILRGELANALRLATMDQMAAGLAHELHQPLAAISAATGAALREISDGGFSTERVKEMVDEARIQALRAGTLLGHMRDFIRKTPYETQTVSLNELVQTVITLVRRESQRRRIALEVALENDLPTTTGHLVQLQQVVINLVQNAFHSMSDTEESRRVLRIETYCPGPGSVGIAVSDRGDGFASDVAEEMFDVFFTTRTDGLGMGLAISRSIVDAHSGTLTAENRANGGATFRLVLPVHAASATGS